MFRITLVGLALVGCAVAMVGIVRSDAAKNETVAKMGNVEVESLTVRSRDGKYSVSIHSNDHQAGIWVAENGAKPYCAMLIGKGYPAQILVSDGDGADRTVAMSASPNGGHFQISDKRGEAGRVNIFDAESFRRGLGAFKPAAANLPACLRDGPFRLASEGKAADCCTAKAGGGKTPFCDCAKCDCVNCNCNPGLAIGDRRPWDLLSESIDQALEFDQEIQLREAERAAMEMMRFKWPGTKVEPVGLVE
jgi:hypothetical protein